MNISLISQFRLHLTDWYEQTGKSPKVLTIHNSLVPLLNEEIEAIVKIHLFNTTFENDIDKIEKVLHTTTGFSKFKVRIY